MELKRRTRKYGNVWMNVLVAVAIIGIGFSVAEADEVPNILNYQGHLTDSLGEPVPDDQYALTFTIYDLPAGGNIVCGPELHLDVWVFDGRFSVLLGSIESLPFEVFESSERFIETAVQGETMIPRQRVVSVPYAYYSNFAKTIDADGVVIVDLNADMLDGYSAGHSAGEIPVSDGIVNTNLNADKLDGLEASAMLSRSNHTGTQHPSSISPQGEGSGLNADRVDGYDTGHGSGEIPVSDGQLNVSLDADTVDGKHAHELSKVKVKVGSYVGNSDDNRMISGVGFQPTYVAICSSCGAHPVWKMSGMGSNSKLANGMYTSTMIKSFESDGFRVGTGNQAANGCDGSTYFYYAVRECE